MRTYLWVHIVASVICILLRSKHMTKNEYPRKIMYNLGEDCLGMFLLISMLVWEIWLLGGLQR